MGAQSKQLVPHTLTPLRDYVSVLTQLGAMAILTIAPRHRPHPANDKAD